MSRCFRAEADETRVEGQLYRVHQFTKVNFHKLDFIIHMNREWCLV